MDKKDIDIAKALSRIARAKAILASIEYYKYLEDNYSTWRQRPKDIVDTAKVFSEFIEEDKNG